MLRRRWAICAGRRRSRRRNGRACATPRKYGARCVQGHFFADMVFQDSGPSEDCLFLNVYTPADAKPKSKLPVMFWIHGGGYVAADQLRAAP